MDGPLRHVAVVNVQVLLLSAFPHAGRVLSEAVGFAQRFAHAKSTVTTPRDEGTDLEGEGGIL